MQVDFMLQDMSHGPFWIGVLQIIFVNIILSGDNAVVIAMACLTLPPKQRLWGMILGAGVAVLSMLGTPGLRDLPAAAVLFFFASIAGVFVAAGGAYTGRFSVPVMPITCALAVCAAARLSRWPVGRGG